jgi:lauroyl/myristoyl acyltransferase
MRLQNFVNSWIGVQLGFAIGRIIPPKIGYKLSSSIAGFFSKRKSFGISSAVRDNQFIVSGQKLSKGELDIAVKGVFTHAGRCFVDLYHNFEKQTELLSLIADDQSTRDFIKLSNDQSFGAFIAIPHMSNFDLCLLALAIRGLDAQILTYGQPTGGYQVQNKFREQTGLDITPINRSELRRAIERMRNGGFVITGVDRPIQENSPLLNFFGFPSPLPTGHIRMAIKADVPIIVASVFMDDNGIYHIQFSDPIQMVRYNDLETEIRKNGESVLKLIEKRIQERPNQWLMYYPIWDIITTNNHHG